MDSTKSDAFDISKLVFLGILLAAVAAVWIFSAGRTTLIMAPVPQVCGELTVSMPSGAYWQNPSQGKWTWQPNALVQKSVHSASQDCTVEVQYQLSPITVEPEQHLAAAASTWRLDEVARGQQQIGEATFTWAAMAAGDELPGVYYGVAPLSPQRMLIVRVAARPGASVLAGQVFDAVIQSIKYTDSGLAQKGAEIAKMIQQDGLSPVATQFPSQVLSVKNQAGTETGFLVTKTTLPQGQNEAVIETMRYNADGKTSFSRTLFATSNMVNFILHSWGPPGNSSPLATVRVEDEVLMAAVKGRRMEFNLSDATVAGQIAELAGWNLLKHGMSEAVIDRIENDGTISPVRITAGKAPADPNVKDTSAVFESMAGSGLSSEVFFDPNGAVVRRTDRLEETLWLDRSTAEHIKAIFPNLADEITRFISGAAGSSIRAKEVDYGRKPI